jgi:hypothetical protein
MCFSWSIFIFSFSFILFLFAAINGWITSCLFWRETHYVFIAENTLVFTLIVQQVFSFSSIAFSFHFLPWFLFRTCYLFVSRCIWTSVLCWFSSLRVVSKRLIGAGKEKKVSYLYWYKWELV